jgi:signal transduction histidine kinase
MKYPRLLPRTLLVLVLVFGVTMAATSLSTALRIDVTLTEQYEARGQAIAESIASASVEILLFRDVSTIQAMIDRYLEIRGASYIFVVDARGEVVAHTFSPRFPEELARIEDGPESPVRRIYIENEGEFMDIASPILAGRVGYVHVGMERRFIREKIWSAIAGQLAILGGVFLVCLLLAFVLMRRIVQPLDLLTEHAQNIASADTQGSDRTDPALELVPIAARTDEVGHLAQAFQRMTKEVAKREQQLRQAHAELELRVQERTQELARTNKALSASNADLEQFAFAASHDLQEPLRAISGYCQLLQRQYAGKLDGKAGDYVKNAVDGVERMYTLINDLLEFARVTRRGEPFQPTDFNGVVSEARARLKVAIEEAGATVACDDLPTLPADRGQMIRLLQNLIGNAIKYRAERPCQVNISAEESRGEVQFAVRDNGIGMEAEYFERVFVIFQRLHTRQEYPGTGIGLAICKRIVERHGGRIWVASDVGKGSTFFFTIRKT